MVGPWFGMAILALVLVALLLAAASVREQPRPLLAVHGLHWVVLHGLWKPPGTPSLGWWLLRWTQAFAVVYPLAVMLSVFRVLAPWMPDAASLAFVGVCGMIASAAILGAPWWSSELAAGAEGLRVTGRWPRTPVAVRWSEVSEVRVTGRDLVIEGPRHRVVLSMAWGPRQLLTEVAGVLEATRLSASPSLPVPLPAPPPELEALRVDALRVDGLGVDGLRSAKALGDPVRLERP